MTDTTPTRLGTLRRDHQPDPAMGECSYGSYLPCAVGDLLDTLDTTRARLAACEALADQLVRLSIGFAGAEALNLWRAYHAAKERES